MCTRCLNALTQPPSEEQPQRACASLQPYLLTLHLTLISLSAHALITAVYIMTPVLRISLIVLLGTIITYYINKEEGEELQGHGDASAARQLVSTRLPSRSFLPAISQPILQRLQRVRCALRALMMPISLSYSFYRSTLGASSRFTGIFLYPMHNYKTLSLHFTVVYSCKLTSTLALKY